MIARPTSADRATLPPRASRTRSVPVAIASLLVAATVARTPAAPLAAQAPDEPTSLRWWHPLAAGAGIATLMLIDEPVRDWVQDNESEALTDFAGITDDFKNKEVFFVSGGGAIAIGLLSKQPKVTATGAQILAAYGLSSGIMIGTKWIFGRTRPSGTPDDPTHFDWFDGGENAAFPSGSAAVAFSLATTLADAIDRRPASILLYSAATLNAWARMYGDRHWLSDVALGAVYGITAAKLVNGEWTVFGLELPQVWTDGRTTSMSYRLEL